MAKCTDCLHCDACLQLFKIAIGREPTTNGNKAERVCKNFKDRTKYVKVVHARWEYNGRNDEYFCSNCYKQPISFKREMNCGVGEFVEVCFSDYCPNCGAKMDGGE